MRQVDPDSSWKPGITVMCPDTRQFLTILTGGFFFITKECGIFCGQTRDMPTTVSKL